MAKRLKLVSYYGVDLGPHRLPFDAWPDEAKAIAQELAQLRNRIYRIEQERQRLLHGESTGTLDDLFRD